MKGICIYISLVLAALGAINVSAARADIAWDPTGMELRLTATADGQQGSDPPCNFVEDKDYHPAHVDSTYAVQAVCGNSSAYGHVYTGNDDGLFQFGGSIVSDSAEVGTAGLTVDFVAPFHALDSQPLEVVFHVHAEGTEPNFQMQVQILAQHDVIGQYDLGTRSTYVTDTWVFLNGYVVEGTTYTCHVMVQGLAENGNLDNFSIDSFTWTPRSRMPAEVPIEWAGSAESVQIRSAVQTLQNNVPVCSDAESTLVDPASPNTAYRAHASCPGTVATGRASTGDLDGNLSLTGVVVAAGNDPTQGSGRVSTFQSAGFMAMDEGPLEVRFHVDADPGSHVLAILSGPQGEQDRVEFTTLPDQPLSQEVRLDGYGEPMQNYTMTFLTEVQATAHSNSSAQISDFVYPHTFVSGVGPRQNVPVTLRAEPNPFRASTSLVFQGMAGGSADLDIFDTAGRLIRTIHQGTTPGASHVIWDGRDMTGTSTPAGVYFLRLRRGNDIQTCPVIRVH